MSGATHWSGKDEATLRQAVREGKTFAECAVLLSRSITACRNKACAMKIPQSERPRSVHSGSMFTDAFERKVMASANAAHVAAVLKAQPGGFQRPMRRAA
jgi:hypothetical protein